MGSEENDYFRAEFRDDLAEIASIDAILERVWHTLVECRTPEGWPYVIEEGKKVDVGKEFSASTQSMVLYAIAVRLGLISTRGFGPGQRSGVTDATDLPKDKAKLLSDLAEVATSGLEQLVTKLDETICDDSSFGKKNPFTLAWLLAISGGVELNRKDLLINKMSEQIVKPGFLQQLGTWAQTATGRLKQLNLSNPVLLELPEEKGIASIHSFPALRAVQLLLIAKRACDAATKIDTLCNTKEIAEVVSKLDSSAVRTAGQWFLSRMLDHIAYASIEDAPFDAAELVFSLEGYLLCEEGRNHDPDVVEKVFSVMARRQEINPYWRPLKPLLTDKRGFALLPLSVEIVNSLLRTCWLLKTPEEQFFSQHVKVFQRYHKWIKSRLSYGRFIGSDDKSREFTGWHSEHVQQPGSVHVWETSQVAIYLAQYRDMLQKHLARRAFQRAHLSSRVVPRRKREFIDASPVDYWNKAVKDNDPSPPKSEVFTDICKHFIECRSPGIGGRKSYSMVLYGPPGTGKTSIAEDLASSLGWTFVEITPSDFVASGESAVELRATEIFAALGQQEDMVILFDEIDRLILDRDAPIYQEQGDMFQVMTPGMLPKLKDLRSRQKCIFILATNYKERLDPAAIRIGRVDKRLLVSLPNAKARAGILARELNDEIEKKQKARILSGAPAAVKGGLAAKKYAFVATDVATIADFCVLGAYGELCELVRDVVVKLQNEKKFQTHPDGSYVLKTDVDAILTSEAKTFSAAVRLDSYRERFKACLPKDNDARTKEQPYAEFIDLAGLACETSAVRTLLKRTSCETIGKVLARACVDFDVNVDGSDMKKPKGVLPHVRTLATLPEFTDSSDALKAIADSMEHDAVWEKVSL